MQEIIAHVQAYASDSVWSDHGAREEECQRKTAQRAWGRISGLTLQCRHLGVISMNIGTEQRIEMPGYNPDLPLTLCGQVDKTSAFSRHQTIYLQNEEAHEISEVPSSSKIPSTIQIQI